jgi:hypothetical protein
MPSSDTQFKKGKSGNPKGKPKGAKNKSTLMAETLLDNEAENITRKAVQLALDGDVNALRLVLSRIIPIKRDRHINLELPELGDTQDALKAISAVVDSVGAGEITPMEGRTIASLLEVHRRTLEMEELEQRLEELEARQQ